MAIQITTVLGGTSQTVETDETAKEFVVGLRKVQTAGWIEVKGGAFVQVSQIVSLKEKPKPGRGSTAVSKGRVPVTTRRK